jgi:hypothetical protein
VNCKFENIIINNTAQCDCEKQIKNSGDNNSSTPIQKNVGKEKITEELFTLITQKRTLHFSIENINIPKTATALLLSGFNATIFQPPRIIILV